MFHYNALMKQKFIEKSFRNDIYITMYISKISYLKLVHRNSLSMKILMLKQTLNCLFY